MWEMLVWTLLLSTYTHQALQVPHTLLYFFSGEITVHVCLGFPKPIGLKNSFCYSFCKTAFCHFIHREVQDSSLFCLGPLAHVRSLQSPTKLHVNAYSFRDPERCHSSLGQQLAFPIYSGSQRPL